MQHLNIDLSNWALQFKCPFPKWDMIHEFMHKKYDFCIPECVNLFDTPLSQSCLTKPSSFFIQFNYKSISIGCHFLSFPNHLFYRRP